MLFSSSWGKDGLFWLCGRSSSELVEGRGAEELPKAVAVVLVVVLAVVLEAEVDGKRDADGCCG